MAWLAGLLEGEGSFFMSINHRGGAQYRYPKVIVNMTDRDVVERVAGLFGTGVYLMPKPPKYPDRKQQWRAQVSGLSGAAWMNRLYPWLGARRRAKIDEILTEYLDGAEPNERRRLWSREATTRRHRNEQGQFVTEIDASQGL